MLLPRRLFLSVQAFERADLSLLDAVEESPPLPINNLILRSPIDTCFEELSPILRMLNPRRLQLGLPTRPGVKPHLPSVFRVASSSLSFSLRWTRLYHIIFSGQRSYPLLYGTKRTFAFMECLERCNQPEGKVTFAVVWDHPNDEREEELVEENEVLASFHKEVSSKRVDVHLCVHVDG